MAIIIYLGVQRVQLRVRTSRCQHGKGSQVLHRDALLLAITGKDGNRLHQILSGVGVGLGHRGGGG